MNTLGGALEFEFDIRLETFEKKLASIEGQLKTMTGSIETQTSKIDDAYKKLAAGIAAYFTIDTIKGFGTQLIEVRGQFEQLGIAFETMLGSKEKADLLMARITELAAKTPFSLTDVASGAKKLIAFGESADTVTDTIKRLGDIASGTGADLGELTAAYGKSMSKGKIQAEEMNMFTERGIPLVKELAKQFNVTESEVFKLVSDGKVGFENLNKVIKGLTDEGGMFFNLMEKQSSSVTGMVSNLGDAWDRMLNNIGQANEGPIKDSISFAIKLVENYELVIDAVKVLIATYGAYKAALIVTSFMEQAKQAGSLAKALRETAIAQKLLNLAQNSNPYVLIASAVTAAVGGILLYNKHAKETVTISENFKTELKTQTSEIDKNFKALKDSAAGSRERAEAIKTINEKYKEYLPNLLTEKTTLEDVRKAQDEVTKAIAKTISMKAQQADLEKIKEETGKAETSYSERLKTFAQDAKLSAEQTGKANAKFDEIVSKFQSQPNFKYGDQIRILQDVKNVLKDLNIEITNFGLGADVSYLSVGNLSKELENIVKARINERNKTEELGKVYDSYLKTLGLAGKIDPPKPVDVPKEYLDTLDNLNKKLAALKKLRGETSTSDIQALAAIDEQTEAYKNEIEAIELKISRLRESKRLENEQSKLVVNTNLDKPVSVTISEEKKKELKTEDPISKYANEQELERQKRLFEEIDDLNRWQLRNKLEALNKELFMEEKLGKDVTKIRKQIAKVNAKLSDDAYDNAMDVADAIRDLAGTIGGEIGEVFVNLSSGFQGMYSGFKNLTAEGAGFGQQFMGAAGMITTAMNFIQKVSSDLDLLGNKKAEEDNRRYYEAQERSITNITKLIELQTSALKELKGEEKISTRSTVIDQLKADSQRILSQAQNNVRILKNTNVEAKKILGVEVGVTVTKEWANLTKASFEELKQIRDNYLAGNAKSQYGTIGADEFKVLDDYVNKYEETQQKIRDIQNEINAELTGSTYDSILSGLVDAFSDGTLTAEEFGNNFNEIMKKSIMNSFSRKFLEKQLEGWYDQFASATQSDGQLTSDEVTNLRASLEKITTDAQAGLKTLAETAGLDLANSADANQSALSGAVKSIQEDTANILAGQMNAIRLSVIEQKNIAMTGLNNLILIEYNTRLTASNTGRMVELMTSSQSSEINNNRANGI